MEPGRGRVRLEVPRSSEPRAHAGGDRGLLTLTPIVVVALVGCWWAWRERLEERRDAIVAVATLVLMIPVTTGIDGYGGSPGPRHHHACRCSRSRSPSWQRIPTASWAAAWAFGAGVDGRGDAHWTLRGWPDSPHADWFRDLPRGDWAPNVVTGTDHVWLTMLSAGAGLRRSDSRWCAAPWPRPRLEPRPAPCILGHDGARPPAGTIPDTPGSYQFKDTDGRSHLRGQGPVPARSACRTTSRTRATCPPRTAQMVASAETGRVDPGPQRGRGAHARVHASSSSTSRGSTSG